MNTVKQISANGMTINYEVGGKEDAPWVVFSHSLGCSKAMWQPQFDALAKSYRVLRYDIRGHGASSAPPAPYSLDAMAQDVKALLDALAIRKCHFVGLSMGGMIGQTFALKYPELLLSLTLANTSSNYGPDFMAFWETRSQTVLMQGMTPLVAPSLERWFTAPFRAAHPVLMQEAMQWVLDTSAHGYAACCMAIAVIDTTARLKEIKMPVQIIVGKDDLATPPAMSEKIQAQIAGSKLLMLEPAAHISSVEQAEKFTRALQEFLAGVPA
ncbi:MAG TPA: 3-oxoadipate enol-lactonase [Herbaspirillum sp.]